MFWRTTTDEKYNNLNPRGSYVLRSVLPDFLKYFFAPTLPYAMRQSYLWFAMSHFSYAHVLEHAYRLTILISLPAPPEDGQGNDYSADYITVNT